MRALVIAEAGVNHNGDLRLALELVDKAAEVGADIVKFQTFKAAKLATRLAQKAKYQQNSTGANENQRDMLSALELTEEAHRVIVERCRTKGIEFASSGFDVEDVSYLLRLGMRIIKVPSGEITNLPYLRFIGAQQKRVLLSTGMATLGEVEEAISVLEHSGTSRSQITVLHCTSEYPAPVSDVNLRAILTLRDAFRVAAGYSDHTAGIEIPIAAVAIGATVIEKHFTLDRSLPGPDHASSLEPEEFLHMVEAIRKVEAAMGDGIKKPTAGELETRLVVRRSLVAAKDIREGERFSEDNVTVKRPAAGISPMRWDEIIGRVARRHFSPEETIDL